MILSLVSKVFHPIGLVAPFTVGVRLLLKDIWRITGQHWDDELPQDKVQRFLALSADLPKLKHQNSSNFCFFFTGHFDNVELDLFDESSRETFSAVAFLRAQVTTPTGAVKTELAFVLGEARVVPIKVMTLPKLKIQAALLAARPKRENTQALTVTKYSSGQTARPFANGITPKKSNLCCKPCLQNFGVHQPMEPRCN